MADAEAGPRGRWRPSSPEERARVRRIVVTTVLTIGALFVAFALAPLDGNDRWMGIALNLGLVVAAIPYVTRRIRAVLRSAHPFADALSGVAILFAVLVIVPAVSYYSINATDPASFTGMETKIDAVYFSIVIISTVGFGDITPASQGARAVTTVHIVFTIALLGTAVRLLTEAARRRLSS